MMNREKARAFANHWIESWNSHDLDKILSHYTEDFEMTTPFIVSIANDPTGTLKGKANVGNYWAQSLKKFPTLTFQLIDVLYSINSVTIYYQSVLNKKAVEFFLFNPEGKVYKAIAHYNE
jgi:ketosteroid isomerase-like protein